MLGIAVGSEDYSVLSLDWCNECGLLAAVAVMPTHVVSACPRTFSIFQVYSFNPQDPGNLVAIDGTTTIDDSISQIKWCPDCNHLVAAGYNYVYVYDFYSTATPALVLSTSADYNGTSYNSVDVCDNCEYIAAGGGNSSGYGEVDIYYFDSTTQLLTSVTSTIISSDASFK